MKSLHFEIRNTIRIRERQVVREIIKPIFELGYKQLQEAPLAFVTQKPDFEVVQGIKDLDGDIFSYIYERIFPKVKERILQKNGNADIANDIFQETMIDIFEQSKRGKLKITDSIENYIITIAVRKWGRIFSESVKNKEMPIEEINKIHPIIDSLERTSNFDIISECIDELSESCRKLVYEFYYDGKNWDTIAVDNGYKNARSASNQKYKCLEPLRIKLDAKKYNLWD